MSFILNIVVDFIISTTMRKKPIFNNQLSSAGNYAHTKKTVRKMILKTQKNKDGEVRVYVEATKFSLDSAGKYEKKSRRLNTGVWVLPANWSKSKQEVLGKDVNYRSKNTEINELFIKVQNYIQNLNKNPYGNAVSEELKQLVDIFPSTIFRGKGITEYLDDYVNHRKANGTPRGTWKEFITTKNRLVNYEKYSNRKLYFEDMNLVFSDKFGTWLFSKYNTSTVEKTFSILKTFLNYYYKRRKELNIQLDETFLNDEFKKGKKKPNPANPLTYDEFIELSKKKFESKVLEKTKDRFILQCSTGLRYSDIDKITPDKIDNGRIVIQPTKTLNTKEDNTIYIDLNQYSIAVLEKYNYNTSSLKISNQKYNLNLKDMFAVLEWEKRTSHNGRDTFISICIQNNVSVEMILKWTGQSSYSIMRRYIKLSDDHKKSEMNRVFK